MTDNRTTELRGKLTERGVEYRGDDASYTFATHWADSLGRGCSFVEEVYDGESKTMFVSEPSARNITPEQAVAATLGSERTCCIVKTPSDSDFSDDWRYRCSECGCNIPVNERDPKTGDVINAANYCPNCGARVIGTEVGE